MGFARAFLTLFPTPERSLYVYGDGAVRAGQPFQEEPEGKGFSPAPPSPAWGSAGGGGPAERLHGPSVLQAELIITFEAIGIMLDTREVLVWLDLST